MARKKNNPKSTKVEAVLVPKHRAQKAPAISTARLMNIPIAVPNQSVRDEIVIKVRSAIAAGAKATRLLDKAKAIVERAILSGSA